MKNSHSRLRYFEIFSYIRVELMMMMIAERRWKTMMVVGKFISQHLMSRSHLRRKYYDRITWNYHLLFETKKQQIYLLVWQIFLPSFFFLLIFAEWGTICGVVSIFTPPNRNCLVDSRNSENLKDSFVAELSSSVSRYISHSRDIDTQSTIRVWEVRKVLKNVNYKKLMCRPQLLNLSAYQMFEILRSLVHWALASPHEKWVWRRWNFIRWKIIKRASKHIYHVTCYFEMNDDEKWRSDRRRGGEELLDWEEIWFLYVSWVSPSHDIFQTSHENFPIFFLTPDNLRRHSVFPQLVVAVRWQRMEIIKDR